jgi:adenylosuccinate synthase
MAKQNTSSCVVGVQWGDEGKGKIVDILAEKADVVVRFQGGGNAGHTVVVDGVKHVLHLIPSGILHKSVCVIANGVVVDLIQLLDEMAEIQKRGIKVDGRIFLSDRAHVVMPYHKFLDKCSETNAGNGKIGTTQRGIGPCYADKAARKGIRVADLYNEEFFKERVFAFTAEKNKILQALYGAEPLDPQRSWTSTAATREAQAVHHRRGGDGERGDRQGRKVLFEGRRAACSTSISGPTRSSRRPIPTPAGSRPGLRRAARKIGNNPRRGQGLLHPGRRGAVPDGAHDDLGEKLRQVGGRVRAPRRPSAPLRAGSTA